VNPQQYFITEQHFLLFGRIVSDYARAEVGFRLLLAEMMRLPGEMALLISSPYSSAHLRNVTKSVAKIVLHDEPHLLDNLIRAVGAHQALSQIRNDISHNLWRDAGNGCITPIYTDVREGRFRFQGVSEGGRKYSIADLENFAANASAATLAILSILDDQALADCMARKADLRSLDMDSILGIS
tara:strand:- start:36903 stop:37454 length:552 start_codon:yes stop_codon:yes gene_type:complete